MVQVRKRISLCDDVKKPQLRKVRIIVNDPYATDDSSSDEEEEFKPVRKVKRIVHEINFPSLESSPISKEGEDDDTPQKHIGVRQRKWGKWASEIRHPINKTRDWLGTYNTFEEAVKVYEDKKSEFDALVANKVTKTVSVVSETSSASALTSENDLVKEEITSNDNGVLFDFNFADLQIPDIGFLAEGNGHDLDFDCFLKDDQLDIGFHGFEDNTPTELPDFDFVDVDELELGDSSFAFLDQLAPLNIPCPMKSFAAS